MANQIETEIGKIVSAIEPDENNRSRASVITVRFTPAERRRVNRVAAKLSAVRGARVSTNALCLQAILARLDQLESDLDGGPPGDVPAPPMAPTVKPPRRMGEGD